MASSNAPRTPRKAAGLAASGDAAEASPPIPRFGGRRKTHLQRRRLSQHSLAAYEARLFRSFPNAAQQDRTLVCATHALRAVGFRPENTIAMVGACRDELTEPFRETVNEIWGESFNICALAGLVFCGTTGFGAAMHHAPVDKADGRERYVVFCGPHLSLIHI